MLQQKRMQRKDVVCTKCNRSFESIAAHIQHYRDTHVWENQRVKCIYCERSFCDETAMNKHREHKHPNGVRSTITVMSKPKKIQFICSTCRREYPTLDQLHDHQTITACLNRTGSHIWLADEPGSLKCEVCAKVCDNHVSLEQHFNSNHAVIKLLEMDKNRIEQERVFLAQWMKETKSRLNIQAVFRIYNSAWRVARYERYRSEIEPNCRGIVQSPGNEMLLYHGTSLTCELGSENQGAKLCNIKERKCNMCNILRQGFQQSKAASNKWQRFGPGIYTTSQCNKSDDYIPREAHRRAVFVCKVLTGKVFETQKNMPHLTGPPKGYDSVCGKPGSDLNYDEYVVYNDRAILPGYIIVYTKESKRSLW